MDRHHVERQRAMMIACYALWQLRDLDPGGEPSDFKRARLELRRRLLPPETTVTAGNGLAEVRHLSLVGGEG
jgi:hypothetical protein